MNTSLSATVGGIALLCMLVSSSASAQSGVKFVGMGDSIGEGVQSADASEETQGYSFLNLMAWRMGAAFPLPLIRTSLFAAVGSTDGRSRIDTSVRSYNLAVSGADVTSILTDAATAADPSQIDTETELVLFPEIGSQMEVAERLQPEFMAVWIGNNDALGAALAYDQLNATQLTPVPEFVQRFTQLVDRVEGTGAKAVFGTIPDITGIGFLLNRLDLIRFLGTDYGLPEGHLTGVPTMFLVKLGLASGAVFSDPDYVLDPIEQAIVSQHIDILNAVIRAVVYNRGMAVADVGAVFDVLSAAGPFDFMGRTLTTRFLGGLFSLDGVHPSNTGHALAAYFFIEALNQRYGAAVPQLDGGTLSWLVETDPHVDLDGDGRVRGRFGLGLLETMMSFAGFSGDSNESLAAATLDGASGEASVAEAALGAERGLAEYERLTGRDLRTMSAADRKAAVRNLFGTARFAR